MGIAGNQVSFKKKRNHDLAYLIILLTVLFATFLFAMIVVNDLLGKIGV